MGCGASNEKRSDAQRQEDKAKRLALGKYAAPKIEFVNLLSHCNGHVPRARKYHTMTAVDDHSLFVIGGLCSTEDTKDPSICKMTKENPAVTSSVNRFAVRDLTWHQVPAGGDGFHPSGRGMHSCVNYEGDIYLMGAHNKKDPQLYMLKSAFGMWRLVEDSGQRPRSTAGHSCVVAGGTMWVFGGEDESGVTNQLHCFEFETKDWTQVDGVMDGSQLLPRRDHSCVVFEELMLMFGGFGNNSDKLEFVQFSAVNKTWSEVFVCSERKPEKRGGHCCELYHQYMMIFGGQHHGKNLNDLWVYDILTSVWTEVDLSHTRPPTRRAFARSAIAGPFVYFFGGGDDDALYRDIYRVDANEVVKSADGTFMAPEPGLTEMQLKKYREEQFEKRVESLDPKEKERLKKMEKRTQHYNQKHISNLWSDAMNRAAQVVIH